MLPLPWRLRRMARRMGPTAHARAAAGGDEVKVGDMLIRDSSGGIV